MKFSAPMQSEFCFFLYKSAIRPKLLPNLQKNFLRKDRLTNFILSFEMHFMMRLLCWKSPIIKIKWLARKTSARQKCDQYYVMGPKWNLNAYKRGLSSV